MQQPPSSDPSADRTGNANPLPHSSHSSTNGPANSPAPPAADASGAPASYSAAAVPMRVYRELAAELQATQAMLDTLESRNQYLTRQNQQLTQQKQQLQAEVVNVVNATLSMRQVAESFQERPDDIPLDRAKPPIASQPQPPQPPSIAAATTAPPSAPTDYSIASGVGAAFDPGLTEPTTLHTETVGGYERYTSGYADDPGERSGLWLLVAIAATVVTAFGAGYWLVRPLLQGGQSR